MKTPRRKIIVGVAIGAGAIAAVAAGYYFYHETEYDLSHLTLYGPMPIVAEKKDDETFSGDSGTIERETMEGVVEYRSERTHPTLYGPAPAPEVHRVDVGKKVQEAEEVSVEQPTDAQIEDSVNGEDKDE